MKHFLKIIAIFITATSISSCKPNNDNTKKHDSYTQKDQKQIIVFAAASLTDVLGEIIDSFEVNHLVKVKTNMASSGTLARQIEEGEIPDIYISANKKWANYIDSLGFILEGSKLEIAQNELVLVAPKNSILTINNIDSLLNFVSLIGKERLSIGDPKHVPAGKYAKQSLEYYGWYSQLQNKILPAKDVRSALMVVEMEETPVGIVYQTDAQKSNKVKIIGFFPEKSHKPIVYIAEICNNNKIAKDFLYYLTSSETKSIWKKYGFKK